MPYYTVSYHIDLRIKKPHTILKHYATYNALFWNIDRQL